MLRFDFDGPAHGILRNHLDLSGTADLEPGAFLADALVDVTDRSDPQVPIADVSDFDELSAPHAYGPAGEIDPCPGVPICGTSTGEFVFGAGYSPPAEHGRVHLRYYFVLRAAHIHYRVNALHGWRLRDYRGTVERITDAQSAGAGAGTFGDEAGALTDVSSSRTTAGTVAIAVPPCEDRGAGTLSLTGGTKSLAVPCGEGPAGAVAYRPVTWHLTGVAAGVSHGRTRLMVLAL